MAHAAGSSLIRLAFIGCGGRGGGAVSQALSTSGPVRLVAMADVFADRIEDSLKYLMRIDAIRHRIDVPPERRFVGFDAYQKAIDCGVDMVILTTPPHFRPLHYAAAVKAGKHVYMEKPVAVDAPGVRMVEEANVAAKKKNLKVAVGFQRRHEADCRDALRRIRDGQLGPVRLIRTYYLMDGPMGGGFRRPGETEMEYQLRHWLYFTWLSGDHFVEQSVHAVDLTNWVANAKPLRAQAVGGRQVRVGKGTGQIFDHGVVEYEYPDNCRAIAFARQIAGCYSYLGQHVQGTKGELKDGRRHRGPAGQDAAKTESLPVAARPAVCRHPPQRDFLRSHLRRHQHPGGDHGAHGPLLRQRSHLGAGHRVEALAGPGPLRLGCRSAGAPRQERLLSCRRAGDDQGVVTGIKQRDTGYSAFAV